MNVEISGLSQYYGRQPVLREVDLQLGRGVFGLLGPNGAGKTTLLRTLATVMPARNGHVQLLGFDVSDRRQRREFRRRLGYLPQQLGFYPNFTVFEFVEYFALLKEVDSGRVREAVADALVQVGLDTRAKSKMKTLSGGMLRRAGIAQAIVNRPDLLLLDEPTAGLDPEQRVLFRSLIRDLGERATVIVSTHLIEDVAAACGEVGLLSDGRFVFRGTPVELALAGAADGIGDTAMERGYTRMLATARS